MGAADLAPKNKDELHSWIKAYLGLHIPRVPVYPGSCAPFDLISDIYFRRVQRALVLACRGGGKTLNFSLLNLLRSKFHERSGTGHFAAVEAQGDWGMSYLKTWLQKSYLARDIVKDYTDYVEWANGSWVRRGSGYATRGVTASHPNRLVIDEVDLWTPEQFETAQFMVSGTKEHPPETLIASTAYTAHGMMLSTLLPQAKKRNFKLYRWTVFETLEQCRKCRKAKCPLYQWEHPRTGQKAALCGGRALHSDGYVPLDVAIDEYYRTDADTYLVQKLLAAPERQHLIYPRFLPDLHAPGPPPEDVKRYGQYGIGVDWGFDHPLVFTVFAEMPNGVYWGIEEHGERFATPDREVEIAKDFQAKYGVEVPFYCGKDQPKSIQAFYEAGLVVIPNLVDRRDDGHRYVRRLMDPNKGPLLYLDPDEMPATVHQLGAIHRNDRGKEVLKDNDFADSSRHVLASAQEAGGIQAGGGFMV